MDNIICPNCDENVIIDDHCDTCGYEEHVYDDVDIDNSFQENQLNEYIES